MLSFSKFRSFLAEHGFSVEQIFGSSKRCLYVRVLTPDGGTLLVDIPRAYKFDVRQEPELLQVERVSVSGDHGVENFARVDEPAVQQAYAGDTLGELPETHKLPIEDHLNSVYKRPVVVRDKHSKTTLHAHEIKRQLGRLKYTVRGTPHRIAIALDSLVGVLGKNDEEIILQTGQASAARRLFVVVEFNVLYDKISQLGEETTHIVDMIYGVLDQNQQLHSRNMKTMIERNSAVSDTASGIHARRLETQALLRKYRELLRDISKKERIVVEKLTDARSAEAQNVHHDLKLSKNRQRAQSDLANIRKTRAEILRVLLEVESLYADTMLSTDALVYNNILMLDQILANFGKLKKLAEQQD